ncbi:hypothetical protein MTP02_28980 [Streptomyces albus]|nr:hypothetical protein MTP02_28980 [Streptomyces albus]
MGYSKRNAWRGRARERPRQREGRRGPCRRPPPGGGKRKSPPSPWEEGAGSSKRWAHQRDAVPAGVTGRIQPLRFQRGLSSRRPKEDEDEEDGPPRWSSRRP